MDFKYPQPFTFAQVSELDISTLAEEITRLQNSLHRLQSTQNELQLLVDTMSKPDAEFTAAIEENKSVIDSQEERITILKSVLAGKGVPFNSHYDLAAPGTQPDPTPVQPVVEEPGDYDGVGLHL